MKKINQLVFALAFVFFASLCFAEKTNTGFYYPTGRAPIPNDVSWLDCDGNYFDGLCHIGHDFMAAVGTSVYPITDGELYYTSTSSDSWGIGNVGVFIKHKKANGEEFLALYGHVKNVSTNNGKVYAGVKFAEVGAYDYGNHLHFGIFPGLNYPLSGWGRLPSPAVSPYNGFVDPIHWIEAQSPYQILSSQTPIKFTDSPTVYLYSNNQLWPIFNETMYTLLGFGDCNLIPAWSRVVELPVDRKSGFTIRSEKIGEPGSPPEKKISYRVTSVNCYSAYYDSTKLYVLGSDNKFHHITNWDTYVNMGFSANSTDIVDITYDLFQHFGEGATIASSSDVSIVLADNYEAEYPDPIPIGGGLYSPENLKADNIGVNSVSLSWDKGLNENDPYYRVYRGADSNFNAASLLTQTSSTSRTDYNLQTDFSYYYWVTAYSEGEESAPAGPLSAHTQTIIDTSQQKPAAPVLQLIVSE